jgi:hypothetical protein
MKRLWSKIQEASPTPFISLMLIFFGFICGIAFMIVASWYMPDSK